MKDPEKPTHAPEEVAAQNLSDDIRRSPHEMLPMIQQQREEETAAREPQLPPDAGIDSAPLEGVTPRQVADLLPRTPGEARAKASAEVQVDHTVSLTVNGDGKLVLNWSDPNSYEYWDYIALFDGDPFKEGAKSYLSWQWQWARKATSGSYTTNTKRDPVRTYWVAYCRWDEGKEKYVVSSVGKLPYAVKLTLELLTDYTPVHVQGKPELGAVWRFLLNWSPAEFASKWDWVGLWDHEPVNTEHYLAYCWAVHHRSGEKATDAQFDPSPSKAYWIAYCAYSYTQGAYTILWKQRFLWQPSWMADLGPKIQDKKLRELVLPASHDSATYGITKNSLLSPDLPPKYRLGIDRPVVARWTRTQVITFAQQLDAGYRAFDLRVATGSSDDDFWIYHGMYSVRLTDVLNAVRAFSVANPKEIVALLLSHLIDGKSEPGNAVPMSPQDQGRLIKLLKDTLGTDRLANNSLGLDAAVQDFWTARTPIVIIYENAPTDPVLWNQSSTIVVDANYSQDNFHSAKDAVAWLEKNVIPKKYDKFWDLPLILTLDGWRVFEELLVYGVYGGLAHWTSHTAVSPFTNFYERQTRNLNVIAVDYVNCYPLVRWAISKNAETQQPKTRQAAQGGTDR